MKMTRLPGLALAAGLLAASAQAAPIISEIMAANTATVADEDGTFADWIEIHNPDATPVDLGGWSLTDAAAVPKKWVFPAGVTMAPGEFLVVWASGKDRRTDPARLHTNFALSASGEYLALVAPDGVTKATEFAPAFPPMEEDESWGVVFTGTTFVQAGNPVSVKVPADGALGGTWTERTFAPDGTWTSGALNLGFGMQVPGWSVQERLSSVQLSTLALAEACANGTNALDNLQAVRPVLNSSGSGSGTGHFGDEIDFLHSAAEDFVVRATGTVTIPTTGAWTFCLNSDDGGRIRIDRNRDGDFTDAGEAVLVVDQLRGASDSFGTATLTAGAYGIEVVYFERGGGEALEVSAAPGTFTSFQTTFRLVGDTASGGLAVTTAPGAGAAGQGSVSMNLQTAMRNVNATAWVRVPFTVADPSALRNLGLRLAWNDGFVAWINGTEVARSNAPAAPAWNSAATASRSVVESLEPASFNATAAIGSLVAGTNVLAIQGLNDAVGDSVFYLAPELTGAAIGTEGNLFFRAPTPGAANTTVGYLGHVADTVFAPKRGHYTTPQAVSITSATPGAVIRYTLDGSTPTATTGTVYTAPLAISSTTVVRAAAFKAGYEPTNVDTHTYIFVSDVITQSTTAPPGWPNTLASTSWPAPQYRATGSNQIFNYGMDPTIVNNTNPTLGGATQLKNSLMALPTLCLTTDMANLTSAATGIYTHANSHGRSWERPASLELFNDVYDPDTAVPANEKGFAENCGLRIRGGFSRSDDNPKHAWRIFFRSEYGRGSLRYRLFQDEGADEFDTFDIQCSQNYSWSFQNDGSNNFLREIWSRDTQLAMGWPSTRGRFYHLYVNGLYWGLYQIEERPESAFGASYLGGNKDDFDVIKHTGNNAGYTTEATDGNFTVTPEGEAAPWKQLWDLTRRSWAVNTNRNPANLSATLVSTAEEKNAAFFKIFGLAADGKTPTGDPVLLNMDNLIDYMLVVFFTGNADSPLVSGGNSPNNFFCLRDRTRNNFGFISVQHDAEHSLNAGGAQPDRIGSTLDSVYKYAYYNSPTGDWNNVNKSNPQYFHQDLMPNAEYRMRFADRIYRHMFNDGVLTTQSNRDRLLARAAVVEQGIMAESARWGNSKSGTAFTAATWRSARDATLNWFTSRNTTFLNQARTKFLYPTINPPNFNQRGGSVAGGFQVTLTNPNASGTIYYTTDGTDPRPVGVGTTSTTLVPEFSNAEWHVPRATNGGSTLTVADWTNVASPPNAASWAVGQLGFGFNPGGRPATTDFTPYIRTDVQSAMQNAAEGSTATLYVRIPFTLTAEQASSAVGVKVRARFDDSFVVYINGVEAGRKNLSASIVPAWNSASGASNTDTKAVVPEDVNVSAAQLVAGQNMIAFHVMNSVATNADLLFSPEIQLDTLSSVNTTAYTGPITLNSSMTVKTRVANGTEWSALNEASFVVGAVPASAANLVVSEFCYNPTAAQTPAEAGFGDKDFEFIELRNIGSTAVDLTDVAFVEGITFTFAGGPEQMTLPPGGRTVLVGSEDAFHARYGAGAGPVGGVFGGSLSNQGETLRLLAANGSVIKEFAYGTASPWPTAADGEGYSLVLVNPSANPDHSVSTNWRSSAVKNGNPGAEKGTTWAAWKALHGVTDESADADGDGLPPVLEYALGGLPGTPSAAVLPRAGTVEVASGMETAVFATLTFTRSLTADDIDYVVEDSADLDAWETGHAVFVEEHNAGDGTATVVWRTAEPVTPGERRFLRLRVVLRP